MISLQSTATRYLAFRFPIFLYLVVLLTAAAAKSAGQDGSLPSADHSAIQAHFAAAQQAQHDKDYATAEREYQAVLARAPDVAEVRMNLGLVYQLEDRSPEA